MKKVDSPVKRSLSTPNNAADSLNTAKGQTKKEWHTPSPFYETKGVRKMVRSDVDYINTLLIF